MLPSSMGGHPVSLFKPAFTLALFIKAGFNVIQLH
jgi:hypothetical protein